MNTLFTFLLVLTAVSSDSISDFSSANKGFSGSIYKKVSKISNGNFLVSPLSVETVFAFVRSGCKGATADEVRTVLNLPNDSESVFGALGAQNGTYTLHTANKIYIKQGFEIKPKFKDTGIKVYQAHVEQIDFSKKRKAAQTMNNWVATQTENKITHLIDPIALTEKSKVVLLNALYFRANWSKPFPIAYTKKLNFSKSATEVVQADTMLLHNKQFNYYENPELKAKFLELPFQGEGASMVIVLPDEIEGLGSLENQMRKVLKPWNFSSHAVNVALPRFRIETRINVKAVLKKMGLNRVFDKNEADLSGIAGEKGDLVLDKVAQKTFIDVSEEGVEAAAATFVLVVIPMSADPEPPKDFRVNRPFIFYVKVKDLILFVGRVTDPRH